jgi:transcriptional regulator with XRE-family HTH domain
MRDSSISTAVGRLLQQRRLNSGIPLPRLAKKVGLSVSALQRIEEGGTRPSLGTLTDLARHLATSVPELVREAKQAQAAPAKIQNVLSIGPEQIGRAIVELPDGFDKLRVAETAAVRYALEACKGNKSAAARLLGLQRQALARRTEGL